MFGNISRKIKGMTARQSREYMLGYYWHYLLLAAAAVGLASLLGYHLLLAPARPQFTCVLVNQQLDDDCAQLIREQLAAASDAGADGIVMDASYHFSYDDIRLEGVNESSYEKFFLKWSMGELDAVLMPESFYWHCVRMGGVFTPPKVLAEQWFMDNGEPAGIMAAGTKLAPYLKEQAGDAVVIVFPAEGKHPEMTVNFMKFLEP